MAIITIKITPNASKNSIEGMQGEALRIKIAAPPDKGKANEKLIEFLSEQLDIPKSRIKILSGHASRIKRLEIAGLTENECYLRLKATHY